MIKNDEHMVYVEMKKEDYDDLMKNVKEFKETHKRRVSNPINFYFNEKEIQEYLDQEDDIPSIMKTIKYIKRKYFIDSLIYNHVKNIFEYNFTDINLEKLCKHVTGDASNLIVNKTDNKVICNKCKLMFNFIPLEYLEAKKLGEDVLRILDYIETCKAFGNVPIEGLYNLENIKEGIIFLHTLFYHYVDIYHNPDKTEE